MGSNFNLNMEYTLSRRFTAAELVEAMNFTVEDIVTAFYDEIEEHFEELMND